MLNSTKDSIAFRSTFLYIDTVHRVLYIMMQNITMLVHMSVIRGSIDSLKAEIRDRSTQTIKNKPVQ